MKSIEKKVIVIMFMISWVIAGALWIVLPDKAPENSLAQSPTTTAQLTGYPTETVSPTPAPDSYPAQLAIRKVSSQEAEIRIKLRTPTALVGAEVYLAFSEAQAITRTTCGQEWSCQRLSGAGRVVSINALRPLSKSATSLNGEVVLARIVFTGTMPSEWSTNTAEVLESKVLSTTQPGNLLTPYLTVYAVQ